ncbi:MAG: T9SS type A sorting domain-containing protein [Paludibacter sp.]|nr:T9SS type A sorting domain-containing protein [Paludibacter sp.]
MKTSTLKKMAVLLLCIPLFSMSVMATLTHGSVKGTGLRLYSQYNAGTINLTTDKGVSFDFKVVTIGAKTWGWTNVTGATIGGATWASQLRYWGGATFGNKTENNMLNRVATTQQTYGTATTNIPSPLQLSFYQNLTPGGDCESPRITYDVTAKNSAVAGDVTVPVISSCTSSAITETTATLNITGSDDQSDLFYYISGNGISEVSFLPTITLNGLTPTTAYNITVTPIDFSGNEGTPSIVQFTTGGLVQITSGIAQDIKFVLKSTASTLEYYYQYTDPTKRFNGATLGITPAGGNAFDVSPTISPDSTYCYGTTNDANINGKIIALNFKYFTYKLPINYNEWVVANSTITSGTLSGTAIKHQMGGGVSATETEAIAPVLTSATLKDATSSYIKLNINGSDNSGNLYYTISGAKSTVNAFRTGDYFLTAIDPGKVYTLTIKPYDLSGNTAGAQTLTVKTMNARSNIKDSTNTNYNTLVLPTAPNGELTTIIKQSGNTLTLGCTTKSLLLPTGNQNRVFNTPTVVINGTTYPLTLDANNTTATVTFTDMIGSTPFTIGTLMTVKWSVFWGLTGGGNFFTGVFNYVVGDSGQADVTGPSTPVLSLNGSLLTWPACTDDLSGVKSYVVTEAGQSPVTIFDLGGTSFSYTMVDPLLNGVTVKAVDFTGNTTSKTKDIGTAVKQIATNAAVVYPNPATDRINITGDAANVAIYSLQGQLVRSVMNVNTVDVSAIAKGLYFVKVTDKSGNQNSSKIEIR